MCSSICTCMEFILWAAQLSSPKIPSIPFETRDLQFLGFLYPLMRDWVITQCHKQWLRVRTEPKESSHVQALKAGQRPRPRDLRRISWSEWHNSSFPCAQQEGCRQLNKSSRGICISVYPHKGNSWVLPFISFFISSAWISLAFLHIHRRIQIVFQAVVNCDYYYFLM